MKKIIGTLIFIMYVISISLIETSSAISIDNSIARADEFELPKIYFEGDVDKLATKKEEMKISVKYESASINFDAYAKIKLQGSSSIAYDKKNYTIKFYTDEELSEKLDVDLGWGEENKYCLKANWVDKTHSRNIVTANIVADIQKKYNLFLDAPNYGEIDGTPLEIYLNGDFLGLYTLNIPKDGWMFNMDEDNENHLVLSANFNDDSSYFKKEVTYDDWEVEAGEESDENLVRLNRLVSFVADSSDEEFKNDIDKYFNLESLLNYYVMLEFAELDDNVGKNTLLVTYDGKIWYTTLYDLDSSWGTKFNGRETLDYSKKITSGKSLLWEKLEKNFPNELADRYFELRKSILTKEYVLNKFNSFISLIPDSIYEKEKDRWGEIPGYEIEQIEEFLDTRIPILDKRFNDLYTEDTVITVVYNRNYDGTITAQLANVRENIVVLGSDTYTFEEDGEYVFFYNDFFGNKEYIIAKATGVKYKFCRK